MDWLERVRVIKVVKAIIKLTVWSDTKDMEGRVEWAAEEGQAHPLNQGCLLIWHFELALVVIIKSLVSFCCGCFTIVG